MQPKADELARQEDITDRVTAKFTALWNAALQEIAPNMTPVKDAFRVHGNQVLYNSPKHYHNVEREAHLPLKHAFVGPLIREEELTQTYQTWLDANDERPTVYVALGTFLSHRDDVLKKLSHALQQTNVRVAMAIGSNLKSDFEPLPTDWLVEASLPQVGLLQGCDLIIHHGGNNSVQEALALGVRQIILPFSTDQFANASDLERSGQAFVMSPNDICVLSLTKLIKDALALPQPKKSIPFSSAILADALSNR
jgi:MGT family glycosyltransferase